MCRVYKVCFWDPPQQLGRFEWLHVGILRTIADSGGFLVLNIVLGGPTSAGSFGAKVQLAQDQILARSVALGGCLSAALVARKSN